MKHQFTIDRGSTPVGGYIVALVQRDDGAKWRAWLCRYEGKLHGIHRLHGRWRRSPLKPGSANFRFFADLLERTP